MFRSLLFGCLVFACTAAAQEGCPLAPSLEKPSSTENMFSDAQEVDLGDAMAETIALHVNVIQDEGPTAHLRDLGMRLVQHLPPTHLNFRFYLADLPEVNAFSIAGGRVYVSRKLVAFVQSDDELAGVLAHELGHIVTHQTALEMTHAFRELGVTHVSDRADIFRRFHEYVENASGTRRSKRHGEERDQLQADQIAIYAAARAGFPPQAMIEFWDRFNELHGKTGSWWSDMFGTTTPQEHRLREMLKNTAALPSSCVDHRSETGEASFRLWQEEVVGFDDSQHAESLPGLIEKKKLTNRLRSEFTNLRFSPDGKYILAQDDGGINVLSREPFAFLFYIPAPDAHDAHFSPDSSLIVFHTQGLRVETWAVGDRKRRSVHEITLREACMQTDLSLDGNTLACLDSQFSLLLVNVADSTVLYRQQKFFAPSLSELVTLLFGRVAAPSDNADSGAPADALRFINVEFSPDGKFLLASHGVAHFESGILGGQPVAAPTSVLLYDLANRHPVSVPGSIKNIVGTSFAFVGPDKIVGINATSPQKSPVLKFPSGEKVEEVQLGVDISLRGATRGDFLFVGPLKDYPLGILDLASRHIDVEIKQKTADMYDGVFLTERVNGELALHMKEAPAPLAVARIPESGIGKIKAAAVSSDLNYLAISTRSRGVLWDISHDTRVFYTRAFTGAGVDSSALYADFPKFEANPRQLVRLHFDRSPPGIADVKERLVVQHGLFLTEIKPRNRNGTPWSDADLQIEDLASGNVLWSRHFNKDMPTVNFTPQAASVLLWWRMFQPGAQAELHNLPELKTSYGKDDYLCEVADAHVGGLMGYFIAKTKGGSLRFLNGTANRNWAVLEATGDQDVVYTLPMGEEKSHFFGTHPIISSLGLLALETGKREVAVYDVTTSDEFQHYTFAEPVAFKAFSADGATLLVFTNDQTVYLLDMKRPSPAQSVAGATPVH